MTSIRAAEDIFYVFGPFYDEIREIGFSVLFVFLAIAFISEFLKGMEGKSDYRALFVRTLLIAGLFVIYTPFVREITEGMNLLAQFFMPDEEFKETLSKVFTAYKENKDLGMLSLIKMTFLEWMVQGTFNLAYAVMRAFGWVRIIFLSALYLSGPIFLGVSVFLPRMILGWIKWLFEVLSWNVVLSLFVRILAEINFFELYQMADTPALDLVAMNLLVILIIIFFVPLFSSMMIRGSGGFSGAGGALLGLGSALVLRQLAKGAANVRNRFRERSFSKTNSYKGGT